MGHLNTKYWTDQGVGANYQDDSENIKIPRKGIRLLILWVPIKIPFLVCVILLSRAVTAQNVPAWPLWNLCLVLLLDLATGLRNRLMTGPGEEE